MKITKIIDDYYLIDKKNFLTLLIDFLKLVFKLNKKNSILIDLDSFLFCKNFLFTY